MPDENVLTKVAPLQHPALWAAGACCCGIAFDRYLDLSISFYAIIMLIAAAISLGSSRLKNLSNKTLNRDTYFHQRTERVLASRLLEFLPRP